MIISLTNNTILFIGIDDDLDDNNDLRGWFYNDYWT